MNRKNSIFASHDFLMDCSNSVCMECGWYGDDQECGGDQGSRCPECGEITYENEDCKMVGEDSLENLAAELSTHAIMFNRKHGYNSYAADVRTHNMTVEIDLHGELRVRVIDWSEFYKNNSKMANYYVVKHEDINVNLPAHFIVANARDLLWDLEELMECVPFVVTSEYLSWCSEACVDADDPDSHELYLESLND